MPASMFSGPQGRWVGARLVLDIASDMMSDHAAYVDGTGGTTHPLVILTCGLRKLRQDPQTATWLLSDIRQTYILRRNFHPLIHLKLYTATCPTSPDSFPNFARDHPLAPTLNACAAHFLPLRPRSHERVPRTLSPEAERRGWRRRRCPAIGAVRRHRAPAGAQEAWPQARHIRAVSGGCR